MPGKEKASQKYQNDQVWAPVIKEWGVMTVWFFLRNEICKEKVLKARHCSPATFPFKFKLSYKLT